MGTITSVGYDGKIRAVNEGGWADLHPAASSRPGVVTGVTLTIVGNVDRTIRVGAGRLGGWGVLDYLYGNADLQAEPISSGTRWDTVVLRRDWRPTGSPPVPGGVSTLMILTGTSAKARSSLFQDEPGVVADHLLGLIRLQSGLSTIQELEDWREWPSSLAFRYDTDMPNPALFEYGQKVIQSAGPGMGLDVGVRRGATGTESWDMLLTREWKTLTIPGTLVAGITPPQYRVVGDRVELRGNLKPADGKPWVGPGAKGLGDLPTGLFPPLPVRKTIALAGSVPADFLVARVVISGRTSANPGHMEFYVPDGVTVDEVSLDDITFSLTA